MLPSSMYETLRRTRLGISRGAKAVNEANVQAFVQAADRFHPLIVCCYHGNLSQGAADYFNQNGFADTYSLDGGYEAWQTASVGEQIPRG